jgi:nucleoside phosphorylase
MLVFALPEEARALRRRIHRGVFAGREVCLSFAGIGGTAIDQVERTVDSVRPELIVSSGFAGATRSLLEPGDFVLAANYTDPAIGTLLIRHKIVDASGPFAQVKQVASAADKWSLNRTVGSTAVDMESEIIAGLCRRKQISMVTGRMISDGINETIPAIFLGRKISSVKDLSDAAVFAARMLPLTDRLADRLEALVRALRA